MGLWAGGTGPRSGRRARHGFRGGGPGDRFRLRTGSGVIHYAVSSVKIFSKASLATHAQRVFSQSVPGRLALVTCDDWNGSTYKSNAVVLATPRHR